jgi:hypothetical protein
VTVVGEVCCGLSAGMFSLLWAVSRDVQFVVGGQQGCPVCCGLSAGMSSLLWAVSRDVKLAEGDSGQPWTV